jgi:FkbM family methyltransferase
LPHVFSGLIKYKSDPQIYLNNTCVVSPLLLKNKGAEVVFWESILDETSTLILPDPTSSYQTLKARLLGRNVDKLYRKTKVKAITLDLYCTEHRIDKIDILKIDVEGYELGVLEGCTDLLASNRIVCVVLESHDDDMRKSSKGEIDKLLISADMLLTSRIRHPFGNFFEEIWIKNSA